MKSNYRIFLGQLKAAKSDLIAPGVNGELSRLARLAAHLQGPTERKEVARVLRAKGLELGVDVESTVKAIL